MSAAVRAVRGATTVEVDTNEAITERVVALLGQILERNGLAEDDIISILFTATEDLVSTFPATAARSMGLGAVPLICARELAVDGIGAAVHPGHAAREHRTGPVTTSTTSTSRAPRGSVTTSPTEAAAARPGPGGRLTVPGRAMIFGTGLIGGSVGMALRSRGWT